MAYSGVLTVWYLCSVTEHKYHTSVPNWVEIYALVTEIDALASDVYLMTSRELTSAFDFWSRGHLRMAVMHLPVKFGADIYPMRSY